MNREEIYIVIVHPEISEVEIDSAYSTYLRAYKRKKQLIEEWKEDTYGADIEIKKVTIE